MSLVVKTQRIDAAVKRHEPRTSVLQNASALYNYSHSAVVVKIIKKQLRRKPFYEGCRL